MCSDSLIFSVLYRLLISISDNSVNSKLSKLISTSPDIVVPNVGKFGFHDINSISPAISGDITGEISFVSVIFSEEIFKNEESLKNKIREILNQHQRTVERIIEKGQVEGNVRKDIDKQSLSFILMGSLRLLVKRWDLNDHNFSLTKEGEKLLLSLKVILNPE